MSSAKFNRPRFNKTRYNQRRVKAEFVCETLTCEVSGPSIELTVEMPTGPTLAAHLWATARPHRHIPGEFICRPLTATTRAFSARMSGASRFALRPLHAEAQGMTARMLGTLRRFRVAGKQAETRGPFPGRFKVAGPLKVKCQANPPVHQFRVAGKQQSPPVRRFRVAAAEKQPLT